MRQMQVFRREVGKMWLYQLRRRSQRSRWTWSRMRRLIDKYFPALRVLHEYPNIRFRARLNAGAV